jgi:MtN3 and saliva related transmembrane protein
VSLETVLAVAASSFGVVMGAGPLLQIRRMLRERSSRDVSIGYFGIIAFGSLLWASYGVSLGNIALVIPNLVGCVVTIVTILVAVRLRRREGPNTLERPASGRSGGRGGDDGTAAAGDGVLPLPDAEIVWQSAN